MCSEHQHESTLHVLRSIEKEVKRIADDKTDKPLDSTIGISTTQPLIVDYKDRKHLFLWSANALTLTVEDLGTLTVTANTWVNIGYQQGMRLTPVAQAAVVFVFVRATNEGLA